MLFADSLPLDHGYLLYSSISKLQASLHQADWLAIHPINGTPGGVGSLKINRSSRLRFRIPAENLGQLINLAGKRLTLSHRGGISRLTIGVPEVYPLRPAPNLFSRYVAIKLSAIEKTDQSPDREMFLAAVKAQMERMSFRGTVWIDDGRDSHGREYGRRVIHIKDKAIVAYSVYIRDLSEEDSLKLQEVGIGGRRRMGCGIFVPQTDRDRGE